MVRMVMSHKHSEKGEVGRLLDERDDRFGVWDEERGVDENAGLSSND